MCCAEPRMKSRHREERFFARRAPATTGTYSRPRSRMYAASGVLAPLTTPYRPPHTARPIGSEGVQPKGSLAPVAPGGVIRGEGERVNASGANCPGIAADVRAVFAEPIAASQQRPALQTIRASNVPILGTSTGEGHVTAIRGSVIDVAFGSGKLPEVHEAVEIFLNAVRL